MYQISTREAVARDVGMRVESAVYYCVHCKGSRAEPVRWTALK